MNDPSINEQSNEPEQEPTERLSPVAEPDGRSETAAPAALSPVVAAEEAKPLALTWLDHALWMLGSSARAFGPDSPTDFRIGLGLETVRRHFHTDRRRGELTEAAAIRLIDENFQAMRRYLSTSEAIFISADDETASQNTRGYFGSGLIVAAYAYPLDSISFTRHFPPLGPKCKAAVIIHQLAHFIDARMRDQSCGGLIYDAADFETSLFNVHCYPNFAVNSTPPFLDERYGMVRPEI